MILDEICQHKRQEVEARKASTPFYLLEERIRDGKPARDFRQALRKPRVSLIAEVKRASPSKGVFLEDVDPVSLGALYAQAGARAISVLTDERYFQGKLEYLTEIHNSVDAPCLRKDFVIDEYQIHEARAAQADAILLIVRILSEEQIRDYLQIAQHYQMSALVEAHTGEEIETALAAGAGIIGINNRDLDTFEVDLARTLELKRMVPGGHVLVSESGIFTWDDVQRLEDGGVDAILVGEAIVTSGDIAGKVRELSGRDARQDMWPHEA